MSGTKDSARTRWIAIATALVGIHAAWGIARIAPKVWGKRLDEIRAFQTEGAARYFLDTEHLHGAAALERVLAATPPDCAVQWSGDWKGAMEFAQPILFPRLLVPARPERGDTAHGKPIARLPDADGALRPIVLVGQRDLVELAFQ